MTPYNVNRTYERWQIGIGLTVLALLVSLGIIWLFWSYITPETSRTHFITNLQQGVRRKFYKAGVSRVLNLLHRIYGEKSSFRAFNVSLILAYLYPILAFVLTYSYFGGTSSFSGANVLPAQSEYRWLFFPALLLMGVAFYFIANDGQRWANTLDRVIQDWLRQQGLYPQLWQLTIGLSLFALSYFYLKPDSWGWAIFWGGFGYVYGAVAVAVAVAGAFAVAFAVAVAFAFAFAGVLIIISIIQNNYNYAILIAFFYLMMPLINALLDYLSWWVSRAFLEKTLQTDKVWLITLEVLIDAFLAVLFMLALCLLLPAGAIALDTLFSYWVDADGQSAATNWQYYAYAAAIAPFGEGLMVTLMLWTTLLPTFIHLVLGCLAIIIFSLKGQALATFLINTPEGDRLRYTAASLWLYGYLILSIGIVSALIWLILTIADLPIAAWLYDFTRYFYTDYGLPELPQ